MWFGGVGGRKGFSVFGDPAVRERRQSVVTVVRLALALIFMIYFVHKEKPPKVSQQVSLQP